MAAWRQRHALRGAGLWAVALLALVFSGAPWIAAMLGGGLLLVLWHSRRQNSAPDADWLADDARSQRDPLPWAAALLVLILGASALAGQVPVPALQTALARVLTDAALRERLGAGARAAAARLPAWPVQADRFAAVLESVE